MFKIYEYKHNEVSISNEELIEKLKKQSYKAAKNNLPDGASEQEVMFDIFNIGNVVKVVCNIKTEIQIGIRQ